MAYVKKPRRIVARPTWGGGMGFWDELKDAAAGLAAGFSSTSQAQGAMTQSQLDTQRAMAAQGGISGTSVVLLGGAGLAAFLILRKKRAA